MRPNKDEATLTISEYLVTLRAGIRAAVRTRDTWHADTWERLYEYLCEVGISVIDLGPHAAAEYACTAEVLVEYLGNHPHVQRFQLLEKRIMYDLSAAAKMFRAFDELIQSGAYKAAAFDDDEYGLLTTSLWICRESWRSIEQMCPDT